MADFRGMRERLKAKNGPSRNQSPFVFNNLCGNAATEVIFQTGFLEPSCRLYPAKFSLEISGFWK
jgi:hypothetical protein